jgi:hypothetical protein
MRRKKRIITNKKKCGNKYFLMKYQIISVGLPMFFLIFFFKKIKSQRQDFRRENLSFSSERERERERDREREAFSKLIFAEKGGISLPLPVVVLPSPSRAMECFFVHPWCVPVEVDFS